MSAALDARAPAGRRPILRELAASARTILVKELRSRFRGRRAFIVLTLYLAVLALIAYGAYAVEGPAAREQAQFGEAFGTLGNPNASARIGQAIFTVMSLVQLLLVCFISPAFTAGAISLEREKQTLDLLIATPLRPAGLVIGKLIAALGFVLLMIVAGIPISALVLMYGGATIDDILRQQVVLLASAIGLGVIGLFYSALIKRTQAATVLTYSTVLALTLGTLMIWRFWGAVATASDENIFAEQRSGPELLLYVNPAVAMIEIIANTELDYGDFTLALAQLRGSQAGLICDGDQCFPTEPVPGVNGGGAWEPVPLVRGGDDVGLLQAAVRPAPPVTNQLISNYFWPRFTITFAAVALVLTLAAMRLVEPARTRFKLPAIGWRKRQATTPEPGP